VFSFRFGFSHGLAVEGTVGSSELNLVGRLGSIDSMGSPSPDQIILPREKLHILNQTPKVNQLYHFISFSHSPQPPRLVIVG
jgi:hypothetical protein